jgi:small subunit ribosomal protein S4e
MGLKGGRRHLKKLVAPKSWNIQRKDFVWVTKPRAGPHSLKESLPLTTVLSVMLKKTDSKSESVKLIKKGEILVDGRAVKDPKFPVGFMDVLSIPRIKENYLFTYDKYGRLQLYLLEKEQKFKLCRIERKETVKKNKKRIGLHDGRNQLVDKEYAVGGVIKLSVPEQKILDYFEFKKGNVAYIIGGKHAGKIGKILEDVPGTGSREPMTVLEEDGGTFRVPKRYVFVMGRDKPEIKMV